ncbi:MarR family winged helix-turn-helix transcriptional regulator [Streptomyces sp. NPDC059894]|uniref:MarR family winged helix-turn-helix transcriptional regulator n=1 Tax=unclassified Streptomyces TaxID=2593676 RepID=UPI0036631E63
MTISPSTEAQSGTGLAARGEAEADATALIQLSRLIRDTFARVAEHYDLTPVQGRMLCVLAEKPRAMAELARHLGVGKANMTGLVDRAAQRHLVERVPAPEDRRAVHVVLTDDGRRSALAFHQRVTDELNRLLAPLAPQERTAFRSTVLAIAADSALPTAGKAVVDPAPDRNHLGP